MQSHAPSRIAAAALVAVLATAGCGSKGSTSSTVTTAAPATTTTAAAPPTSALSAAAAAATAVYQPIMLRAADLPSGWTDTPSPGATSKSGDQGQAAFDACVGVKDTSKDIVAEINSDNFSSGDIRASSSGTVFSSSADVQQDVAAFTSPKASKCISDTLRAAAASQAASANATIGTIDIKLTPGAAPGRPNQVGVASGTVQLSVPALGTQPITLYVWLSFLKASKGEIQVQLTDINAPIPSDVENTAANAVARASREGLIAERPDVVEFEELVEPAALERQIALGHIRARRHPSEPLTVFDYTARASARAAWTPETRVCRGLIVADDGRVVSRPFPKFFTLEQHDGELPRSRPVVQEKFDGSLGILYPCGDGHTVATRGGFDGPQARWATSYWNATLSRAAPLEPTATYLFEIVYPDNRVVVDYGAFRGLVLIAVLDTATGADQPLPSGWPGPVALPLTDVTSVAQARVAANASGGDREGFVLRFAACDPAEPSLRLKVKSDNYELLHRSMARVSSRTIWEWLARGEDLARLPPGLPPGFEAWAQGHADRLRGAFADVERRARAMLATAVAACGDDREKMAASMAAGGATPAERAIAFKMLAGLDYQDIVWRSVRPPAGRVYRPDAGA